MSKVNFDLTLKIRESMIYGIPWEIQTSEDDLGVKTYRIGWFTIKEPENVCKRCYLGLTLVPENFPWSEEFWICGKCDSTYCKGGFNEKPS